MKKLATRTLALVLAFVLCFALASTVSFAEASIKYKAVVRGANNEYSWLPINTSNEQTLQEILDDDDALALVIYSTDATMPVKTLETDLDLDGKALILSNVVIDGGIVDAKTITTFEGAKVVVRDNDNFEVESIDGENWFNYFSNEGAFDLAARSYAEIYCDAATQIVINDATTAEGAIGGINLASNYVIDIYGDVTYKEAETPVPSSTDVNFLMGTFTVNEGDELVIYDNEWTFAAGTTLVNTGFDGEGFYEEESSNIYVDGGTANFKGTVNNFGSIEADDYGYIYVSGVINNYNDMAIYDAMLDIEFGAQLNIGGAYTNAFDDTFDYEAALVMDAEDAEIYNEGTITVLEAQENIPAFATSNALVLYDGFFQNEIEGTVDVQYKTALVIGEDGYEADVRNLGLIAINGVLDINIEDEDDEQGWMNAWVYGTQTGVITTGTKIEVVNDNIFFDRDGSIEIEDVEEGEFFFVDDNEWSPCDGHKFDAAEDEGFYMTQTCLLCRYKACTCKFNDLDTAAWYYHWVKDAVNEGIFVGDNDAFAPERDMTRAEFVTVLAAIANIDDNMKNDTENTIDEFLADYANASDWLAFTDVDADAWYAPYVAWAYDNEVTAGINASEFAPNAIVTREQACVMLKKYFELKDANKAKFADVDEIADWAIAAVSSCKNVGLVEGDQNGNFNPKDGLTRAAACVLFLNGEDVND